MVRRCIFPGCENKMTSWTRLSFHRLPHGNPELFKLWLVALKMDPNMKPKAVKRLDPRVCSAHFSPDDFFPAKEKKEGQRFQRTTLKSNAIPMAAGEQTEVQNGDEFTSHYSESIEVTFEPDQIEQYMSEPEAPAQSYEDEDDVSEEDEEGDKGNGSSDEEDWLPQTLTEKGNEDVKCESAFPIKPEPDQTEQYMNKPKAPPRIYRDEDDVSEDEDWDKGNGSSDEDWLPQTLTEEGNEHVTGDSSSEEDSSEEEEPDEDQNPRQKKKQLCTECGAFARIHKHICEHKTKPYLCNVCGKRCVTQIALKIHSNIHSETYEHCCRYCSATFKTKLYKLAHEEIHQNQPMPYKCPDCSVTFAKNSERRTHMKEHIRTCEKKYACYICGFVFVKKAGLQRHEMIHTGRKPHKCSICKKTFTQVNHLKSHMRVHTGEQPYKCQHCDRSFNHNVSLKSHLQRYHPLESGEKDCNKSCNVTDTNDNVQIQDTEKTQQKVKQNLGRAGRPLGRPKKSSTVNSESSE